MARRLLAKRPLPPLLLLPLLGWLSLCTLLALLPGGCDGQRQVSPADGPPSDALRPDASVTCQSAITALQAEIYATSGQTCSVVVRLDYDTRAVLGYQVFCGAYGPVDEQTARATAQKYTGQAGDGLMFNPADAQDAYVFKRSGGDLEAAAVVSKRSGLALFHGTTGFGCCGDIIYPSSWRAAEALASGCPVVGPPPAKVGYDLMFTPPPLGADHVDAAYQVVTLTAVPAAFWAGGALFDVVVLRYTRSNEMLEPGHARSEWIVIVNGGSH